MESFGVEIRKGSWNVTGLKSSFAGVRAVDSFIVEAATVKDGVEGLVRRIGASQTKKAAIAVVLPRETAFSRSLEVPAPRAADVPGILGFEAEKHLPLPPGDYYTGHCVTGGKGNIHTVILSAAKKDAVDALLAEFTNAGLTVACVCSPQAALLNSLEQIKALGAGKPVALLSACPETVSIDIFSGKKLAYSKGLKRDGLFPERLSRELKIAADSLGDGNSPGEWFVCFEGEAADDIVEALSKSSGPGGVKFWPKESSPPQGSPFALGAALTALGKGPGRPLLSMKGGFDTEPSYALTAVAAGLAVLFLAVAGGSYIAKDLFEMMSLKSSIASIKGEKSKAQGTIDSYNKLTSKRTILERIGGRAFPGVLDPLSEVARVLPEKTRLTLFETSNGNVRIEGTTESASALILLIEEKSEMLEKAELSGQVVKTDGNMESFALNLSVRGASEDQTEGGRR